MTKAGSMENCFYCKYHRKLKHNFALGEGYEESNCCVVFEYAEPNSRSNFVLEVSEDSKCEMFDPWN